MVNLDDMRHAKRYNAYLAKKLNHAASQCDQLESVLDFGAGNGRFIAQLKHPAAIVHAIETDKQHHPTLARLNASVSEKLETVADNSVDFAWSFNVLEHIKDDSGALKLLVDKLKPGGRLLVFVPAFPCLYSNMDRLVGHERRYCQQELLQKIALAGASVESSQYVDSLGFLAALAYRFLQGSGELNPRSIQFYDSFIFPLSLGLDKLAARVAGKNLLIHAKKRASSCHQ